MDNPNNLTWFDGHIARADRERLHRHPGLVLWFTGLSASGKSTIAHLVEKKLHDRGRSTYVFDGDNIRHGLCSDLGFSEADRTENIRRVGEAARLFIDAGVIVLTALISPIRADRDRIRSFLRPGEFVEIYTKCPVEVCASRDTKGIYERAKRGEIKNFTGISAPYDEPLAPEITLNTDRLSAAEASDVVIGHVEDMIRGWQAQGGGGVP